jgi:hypothetical protein
MGEQSSSSAAPEGVKSCAGLTYFTAAMRKDGKAPYCFGRYDFRAGPRFRECDRIPHQARHHRQRKREPARGASEIASATQTLEETLPSGHRAVGKRHGPVRAPVCLARAARLESSVGEKGTRRRRRSRRRI